MPTIIPTSRLGKRPPNLLFLLLLLVLHGAAASAETLKEVALSLSQRIQSLSERPETASWGQQLSLADLSTWGQSVQASLAFLQQPQPGYTLAELRDQRKALERSRHRFRVSSPLLATDKTVAEVLNEGSRYEACLEMVEKRFDGFALPPRAELANGPLEKLGPPAFFPSPAELAREARSLRFSLGSASRPLSTGPLFGWAGGSTGSAWANRDLYELSQAIVNFEWATQAHYANVKETVPAYQRLARAWDRARTWMYETSGNWRNLQRSLEKLDRFYADVEDRPAP